MPIVHFDSSALVKLLVEEDGSDLAATLWDGCDAAVSRRLAYPEVRMRCIWPVSSPSAPPRRCSPSGTGGFELAHGPRACRHAEWRAGQIQMAGW